MEAITVDKLNFTYSNTGIQALKGINLNIKKGESYLITGPSRAGKSTLCLILTGLIPEHIPGELKGKVFLFGEDITGRRVCDMNGKVGLVFQDYEAQIFSTRVDLEVAFGMENRGISTEMIKKRVPQILELVGLAGLEKRSPWTLSGGQKQRLAIAGILALEPEVMILDEPLTDLDPEGRDEVLGIIKSMKENGKTVLLVEQEIEKADEFCHAMVMKDGLVLLNGETAKVFYGLQEVKDAGVMPHPIVELFKKLKLNENPLNIDEAEKILRMRGIKVNPARIRSMEHKDSKEAIIEFRNVTHVYPGGVEALCGIDLKISRGDFLAIVGKNGSGKTTLVKTINRLVEPTDGDVILMGDRVKGLRRSDIGKRVGYVFQNPDHQIFAESVFEEVCFAPRNFGFSEEVVKQRALEAIRTVGLEGYENSDPFMLTRGEREKVAVASILSATPEIIVLDEPTTGLDWREIKGTMEMLKRLNEAGKTIIIITHNMRVVAEYVKTVLAMRNGRVEYYGSVRNFFSDSGLLSRLSVKPPLITQLSWRFGFTALYLDEFLECLDV